MVQMQSAITCPACGYRSVETMPTDACLYFYTCKRCGLEMKPRRGDCCVFCSYGDVPLPANSGRTRRLWQGLMLRRPGARLTPGSRRAGQFSLKLLALATKVRAKALLARNGDG